MCAWGTAVTESVMNHLFAHVCCHPFTLEPRRSCEQWPRRVSSLQGNKPQCPSLLLPVLPCNGLLSIGPRKRPKESVQAINNVSCYK